MDEVMKKAQELAEAISRSEPYLRMKQLEDEVMSSPEAAAAVSLLAEKRRRVEEILTTKGMDPEALKRANLEMVQAERDMNANPDVARLKTARKEFTGMMDDVNRVLRVVITGEIREEDIGGGAAGCSGDCGSCSGCS